MKFLLPFLLSAAVLAAQPAATIEESIKLLAEITGLEPLKKVDHGTITREGVRKFLEERIAEEVKPEEIRIEELALKRFGFVPENFDLKRATVDLITEQAAAFYDYKRKKLFLLDGENAGGLAQNTVLVHELAHALADQHFDLGKYIKRGRTDDGSTARMAVMEGQATWLMMEAMARQMGQSMQKLPKLADVMAGGVTQAVLEQYPELAKAPLYLRASLMFPYYRGLQFQHALVQKLGNAAFTRVFREPPVSTQQIIHPELYLQGVRPVASPLPALHGRREWKELAEGTVGEFDHAILLEQYLSKKDAEDLSPQWRGGSFALMESRADKARVVLLYSSEWADEDAARRMFEAYKAVLKGKSKRFEPSADTAAELAGLADHGYFRLSLTGSV